MSDPARVSPDWSAPAARAAQPTPSPAAALNAQIEAAWTSPPPMRPRRGFAEAASTVADQLAEITRRLGLDIPPPSPSAPASDATLLLRVAALEAKVEELSALLSLQAPPAPVWHEPSRSETLAEALMESSPYEAPADDPELDAALERFLDSLD